MALAELLAKISIKGVKESTQELGALKSSISSVGPALSGLGNVLGGVENLFKAAAVAAVGLTAATVAIGVEASKVAADLDSLQRGLATLTTGPKDLTDQLARLKEVAKLPGLNFEDAVRGSINLQSAGLSASEAERSLMAFGNALAVAGKGSADLAGVNLALTQMAGKTKVSAEELNQLRERIPSMGQALQRAFGTQESEKIQAMGITGKEAVMLIAAEMEKLPRASGGVANAFENLAQGVKDALTPLGQGINEAFMALSPTIDSIVSKLGKIGESAGEVISAIGRSGVIQTVIEQLGAAMQGLTGSTSFRDIAIDMVAGIASAIGALPSFLSAVWTNIKALFDEGRIYLAGFVAEVGALSNGLLSAIKAISDKGIMGIGEARGFISNAIDTYQMSGDTARGVAEGIYGKTKRVELPDLLGNQKAFADAIRSKLQPLAPLPGDLNYGGNKSSQSAAADNTFAAWDKYLAGIEKNTAKAADALTSRVVGGGPLSKMGITGAERYNAPDPITRSVASGLEREINRAVDKRARSARAQSNLWAVR